MRSPIVNSVNGLEVRGIAGTYVVLLAFNCLKSYCDGLLGFGIQRKDHTNNEVIWLRGLNSEAIVLTVNEAVAKITPAVMVLLEQATHLLKVRRALYSLFLGYSFFTLFWLVCGDLADPAIGWFGTLKILVSPDGLLDKLAVLFWDHPVFVLVGVIIFAASVYDRQKIEGIFAEFWSKLRPALGALLR